jgi:hypothetical protein
LLEKEEAMSTCACDATHISSQNHCEFHSLEREKGSPGVRSLVGSAIVYLVGAFAVAASVVQI